MLGGPYRDWLAALHDSSTSDSDLVAHFFRRAFHLLESGGALGLIATNTIAQGNTRSTGLRWICTHGGEIYDASRRTAWPGLAAVVVSIVHASKGPFAGRKRLDDQEVSRITAFLFHRGGHGDPERLAANAGQSFQGAILRGMGFTFDDTDRTGVASTLDDRRRLIDDDPHNRKAIFPFIGGKELNTNPAQAHHRYAINFLDYPLCRHEGGTSWATAPDGRRREWLQQGVAPPDYPHAVAADWLDLLKIVHQRVRPARNRLGNSAADRKDKMYWWRYTSFRPQLRAAIAGLSRVLANSRVSQRMQFAFLPIGMVYADSLNIFPFDTNAAFCTLQSRPHDIWAHFLGSSMKDDPRYTPSSCFETFPFPDDWTAHTDLEAAGATYYKFRADLMTTRNEGLTTTYGRFHNRDEDAADIVRLRELHAAMDRAVLDAYGWNDISTHCEFILDYPIDEQEWGSKKKPWSYRWPDEILDEVLARLLDLNATRGAAECRMHTDRT